MEESPKTESRTIRTGKLLLKLAVTAVCCWYVSAKIDFQKAGAALQQARWVYLVPALAAFILSKWVAALRLRIYFSDTGLPLSGIQNIRLYWLGMFYNLFLPGSISGDAYKVILLKKKYNAPYKITTAAVLLDRFSGLLGLGIIGAAYTLFVFPQPLITITVITGALLAVIGFYFGTRRFFPAFTANFLPTLSLGVCVQALQVISVYCIMAALEIPAPLTAYIFLFLVSSVASVLPLTIGGLGIRELVFLEGSRRLGLEQEVSVVISLLFYLITLLTSVAGVYFIFHDPLKEKKKGLSTGP